MHACAWDAVRALDSCHGNPTDTAKSGVHLYVHNSISAVSCGTELGASTIQGFERRKGMAPNADEQEIAAQHQVYYGGKLMPSLCPAAVLTTCCTWIASVEVPAKGQSGSARHHFKAKAWPPARTLR